MKNSEKSIFWYYCNKNERIVFASGLIIFLFALTGLLIIIFDFVKNGYNFVGTSGPIIASVLIWSGILLVYFYDKLNKF